MKPRDITVAAIQTMLHWEDPKANLREFDRWFDKLEKDVDLVVLPEMFTTGFSMNTKLAEPMDGPALAFMQVEAQKLNAVITGSIIAEENGKYYNRLLWVRPDGTYAHYDKRHLFRLAGEEKHYAPGEKKLVVDLHGWKICPMVCYDLRFPVWMRNRWKNDAGPLVPDYDALIVIANWPERRVHPWKTLLMARAIENISYVVGLNRVGNDGNFIFHSGDSAIIDFKGEHLKTAVMGREEIITAKLSWQLLEEFRKAFPAGMDADSFTL